MAHELIEQFRLTNNQYEEVIEKVKEAFVHLKQDNLAALNDCNKTIAWVNHDLVENVQKLTTMIDRKCDEKQIEKKIPILVTYYSVEEKEIILAELMRAIRYDREYKMQLMMYRNLSEIKRETSESLVELWTHMAKEDGQDGQMFVNQKF